jgi:hypothetical protein
VTVVVPRLLPVAVSRARRRIVCSVLAGVLLAGCPASSGSDEDGRNPDSRSTASAFASWRDRPVVELVFDVREDLRTVSGSEKAVFTPDLRICELVFRAWPNKPITDGQARYPG